MHPKRLFQFFKTLLGVTAVAAVAGMSALVWDGLHDEIGQADLGVVLGNTVRSDGTPSPRLAARLDRTLELFQRGLFPLVLVSGARGQEGYDEAVAMRDYLVARGVPPAKVLIDSKGYTTLATTRNTLAVMQARQLHSVLVVSQYFHLSRAKLALRRVGVETVYSAHARFFSLRDFYSIARELVGFLSYLLRASVDETEKVTFLLPTNFRSINAKRFVDE